MRLTRVLFLTALVAPFAESILAAAPVCAPTLRGGRVVSDGSADCDYHYKVDGAACSKKGKCPDLNTQKQYCIVTGDLVYTWTVTKTGGTGSVSPATFTGPRLTVTVDPPVSYTVACMVSGCRACCALNPPTCSSPEPPPAAPEAATPESESKTECGGR